MLTVDEVTAAIEQSFANHQCKYVAHWFGKEAIIPGWILGTYRTADFHMTTYTLMLVYDSPDGARRICWYNAEGESLLDLEEFLQTVVNGSAP